MEKFNQYVNEHLAEKKGVEMDWVFTTLTVSSNFCVTTTSFVKYTLNWNYNPMLFADWPCASHQNNLQIEFYIQTIASKMLVVL